MNLPPAPYIIFESLPRDNPTGPTTDSGSRCFHLNMKVQVPLDVSVESESASECESE